MALKTKNKCFLNIYDIPA